MAAESETKPAKPLKLRAEDAEDLAVISACLQDALVHVGAMAYQPRRHRFALVAHRFCWECENEPAAAFPRRYLRVATGVHFDGVLRASLQGIDRSRREQVLELLGIDVKESADAGATVTLVFAGGGAVRLEVECLDCHIADIGAPWAVPLRPRHRIE
jgi:hypothetical protein